MLSILFLLNFNYLLWQMLSRCGPGNIVFIVVQFNSVRSLKACLLVNIHHRPLLIRAQHNPIMISKLPLIPQYSLQVVSPLYVVLVSVFFITNMGDLLVLLVPVITSSELIVVLVDVFLVEFAIVLVSFGNLEDHIAFLIEIFIIWV